MSEPVETLVLELQLVTKIGVMDPRLRNSITRAADALIALQAERDSWRRVAERVEHEKLALQERVERCEADARRYRWLLQYLKVASEGPGSWTCWLHLECIPYRSQTNEPQVLLDELIARFPLRDAALDKAIGG